MEQKSWHRLGAEELQEMFGVQPGTGLSAEDAAARRKESGYNELSEGKGYRLLRCCSISSRISWYWC